MIPITLALTCLGISATSLAARYITGEITKKYKQDEQELKKSINAIRGNFEDVSRTFREQADALRSVNRDKILRLKAELDKEEQAYRDNYAQRESYRKQKLLETDEAAKAEEERLNQDFLAQKEKHLQEIYSLIRERAEKRMSENNDLIEELDKTIRSLKEYRDKQSTQMRKNAFQLLRQELRRGSHKAKAYKNYLESYQRVLKQLCEDQNNELVFSFCLPEKYPYFGALIQFSDDEPEQVRQNGGWCERRFHGLICVRIYVKDRNSIQNGQYFYVDDKQDYPQCGWAYGVSADEAAYYLCKRSGSFTGLPAIVTGYDSLTKEVLMTCGESMQLRMKPQNLLNFSHYPAIHSEITVYPLYEKFQPEEKKNYFYVTQCFEDTEIALTFNEVPVMIPPEKLMMFCDFFRDNNINREYDDAKIAPVDENGIDNDRVKIQFQDVFLMQAVIRKHNLGAMYFEFEDFLDPALDGIHAEDIFVPFHAVIKMYTDAELEEELVGENGKVVSDEMSNLVMTVFREIRQQKELKNANDGSRYFQAWEQLTGQLKEYLTVGKSITCAVKDFPYVRKMRSGDARMNFPIEDSDALREYYDELDRLNENRGKLSFFTECGSHRLNVEIPKDFESVEILLPRDYAEQEDIRMELMQLCEIVIYKFEFHVPEQRQLNALYRFKSGYMANDELHLFALNGEKIHPEQSELPKIALKNNRLAEDKSQYNALIGALREKNLFMIQGPPGTGKTTVIREMIWQTLQASPHAKILVVSQANVAVDNVLRGILEMGNSPSKILRCGHDEKIAEDIRPVSYETKVKEYRQMVARKAAEGNSAAREWLDILDNSAQKNADLGNLFMLSHQIIGATCVGLSQRNIGLEKAEFQLVIVDEAGKALMPEVLIPLNKAKKLILIGDHKQLPPVIHPALYDAEKIELDDRQYFKKEVFDISFFEHEFKSCPDSNKTMLTTQYRMPPMIGTMISELFYDGKIENGRGTEKKHPLYFDTSISLIDMSKVHEYSEKEEGSPTNEYEAQYVVYLIQSIRSICPKARIAVVTPYKGQKRVICSKLPQKMDNNVVVDTVDSFQGDEAEVVIYCTTRANKKTPFFSDYRRLNVAFSRAKNELIIIASAKYLDRYDEKEPVHKVLDYLRGQKNCIREPVQLCI